LRPCALLFLTAPEVVYEAFRKDTMIPVGGNVIMSHDLALIQQSLVLVALTFLVYWWLTVGGVIGKARGLISPEYLRTKEGTPPPAWIVNSGRNFINLFELPVLFYVLAGFYAALDVPVSSLAAMLGWGFVFLRALHSLIHLTINQIGLRFLAHRISVIVLMVMWGHFASIIFLSN
jgi:hypothetical protein